MQVEELLMEALAKLVNQGLHSGAEVLKLMLEAEIEMESPSIQMLEKRGLISRLAPGDNGALAVVEMGFAGGLNGNSGLIFDKASAWQFVEKVAGADTDSDEFDFISAGVLTEIGNIVLNRVLGAISNALSLNLDYVVPNFFQGDLERLWRNADADATALTGVLARTHFKVAEMSTNGTIVLFFDDDSFNILSDMMKQVNLSD
jgi:chemotaxis protein CheC